MSGIRQLLRDELATGAKSTYQLMQRFGVVVYVELRQMRDEGLVHRLVRLDGKTFYGLNRCR
jgi:Fe2+ or Zn2+ uptake regulation protein